MTKEEAKNKLRNAGYKVVDDNSVVTVLIPADAKFDATLKDVREKLKAFGYEASFSIRQVKENEDMPVEDEGDSGVDLTDEVIADPEDDMDDEAGNDPVTDGAGGADDAGDDDAGDDDTGDSDTADSEDDYFDDEDSDMILTEDAVQFSLDDFGLDF